LPPIRWDEGGRIASLSQRLKNRAEKTARSDPSQGWPDPINRRCPELNTASRLAAMTAPSSASRTSITPAGQSIQLQP
jgi:hypothetical protein